MIPHENGNWTSYTSFWGVQRILRRDPEKIIWIHHKAIGKPEKRDVKRYLSQDNQYRKQKRKKKNGKKIVRVLYLIRFQRMKCWKKRRKPFKKTKQLNIKKMGNRNPEKNCISSIDPICRVGRYKINNITFSLLI